jgi:hypothetical protein
LLIQETALDIDGFIPYTVLLATTRQTGGKEKGRRNNFIVHIEGGTTQQKFVHLFEQTKKMADLNEGRFIKCLRKGAP